MSRNGAIKCRSRTCLKQSSAVLVASQREELTNALALNDALQLASGCAGRGRLGAVKFLLGSGTTVHTAKDGPLRSAAQFGHADVLQYLIQNGADVHADDDHALGLASQNGRLKTVELLIQHGADVHAVDNVESGA